MKDVRNVLIEKVKAYDSWFYDFDLGNGDFFTPKCWKVSKVLITLG